MGFITKKKKLFGGNQKDSWNTADVFIVKNDEDKILKEIKESCCKMNR